ncbi:MAG: sulfate permease [Patescibacteria group bacterium]|jgi:SulP family sulfate permease
MQSVRAYFKDTFKFDLISGTVVGLIALPLAIAFAVASGARPEQGIYTSIIAGLVIGLLSGSGFQVSGPTGAFVVILLNVVNNHGIEGLMVAGFMAGVILLVMGLCKFGSIIRFIPYPVTVGFTSGIGVIIFFGQIKDFLGLSFEHRPHDFVETVTMIAQHVVKGVNLSAVIIGLTTLATYVLWQKRVKKFPPAPAALFVGIAVSLILNAFFKNLAPAATIGSIPTGLPRLHLLSFSWETARALLPAAFTIAALGAIESLLSAVVADGMTGKKHNSNKELIAQGIGNMLLPFFSGIPATGAIARTAANIRNGARTRVSSIVHSLVLVIILLFAAPLARYIPLATLAAILMMVAYGMAEIPHFTHLLHSPKQDAAVLITTFLLTIFTDLTIAVGIGVVMAAALFIQRVSKLTIFENIGEIESPDSEEFNRLQETLRAYPQIVLYKVAGPLFFGVATEFESRIRHNRGETLILRMKYVTHMDATGVHALEIIIDRVLNNGGRIYFSTLHPRLVEKLRKLGLVEKVGGEQCFTKTSAEAIELAKADLNKAS